jgi:molecular chaperone GrpE
MTGHPDPAEEPAAPTGATGSDSPPPATPASEPGPGPSPEEDWATRYHYLLAEFDNYRKRTERERDRNRLETRAIVLRQLLPLHDAFDRAEEAARQLPEENPLRRGMALLFREWERFLAGESVQSVARVGERFRPEEEEALAEVRATHSTPDGTIAEVVQQGFRCPGGLLRPAKVLIAREPRSSSVRAASTETSEPEGEVDDLGEEEHGA